VVAEAEEEVVVVEGPESVRVVKGGAGRASLQR
jgi:hypothetical protein